MIHPSISEDRLLSITTAGRIAEAQLRALTVEVDAASQTLSHAQFNLQRETSMTSRGVMREAPREAEEAVSRARSALDALMAERARISAVLLPRVELARACERYARENGIQAVAGLSYTYPISTPNEAPGAAHGRR